MAWRAALELLPPNSVPYQQLTQRIGALVGGWAASAQAGQPQTLSYGREVRGSDPLPLALAKTAGSMLFAAIIYYFFLFHNVTIAVGFVVLMLIHELGHVIAMKYHGLSASPPIFIPFLGAVINMRQAPPNALVESIVGIGGPLLGTIGALACYGLAIQMHNPRLQMELLVVAQLAFMLNLFNLLPVPPLDGGRITAAISPWLWIPGLIGLGVMMYQQIRDGGGFGLVILGLVLFYAFPRIRATLRAQGRDVPYYRVSRRASWTMALLYLSLGGVLLYMFFVRLHGFAIFSGE
jgi:Zn-dependent protease